jgi:hypothetical protein
VTPSGNDTVRVLHVNPGVRFTLNNLAVSGLRREGEKFVIAGSQGRRQHGAARRIHAVR